jgi:hypothetical protein
MSDFNVRSDNVDVEQIMRQIRARIREKRGVDYTEEEIRELANVKLEKFIDPKGVRSGLLEEYRRVSTPEPPAPNFAFGEDTLYETHRGPIRWLRALFRPFLKLLFNPNPLIQALHIQADLNQRNAERAARREQLDALHYEVIHNLVVELTRTGVEVKALKMRLESMASRLDFDERRARALEGVVQYRAGAVPPQQPPAHQDHGRRDQGHRDQGHRDQRPQHGRREQAPQDRWQRPSAQASSPAASAAAVPGSSVAGSSIPGAPVEANALDADGNERRARRRRRRGRRRPGDREGTLPAGPTFPPSAEASAGHHSFSGGGRSGGVDEPASDDVASSSTPDLPPSPEASAARHSFSEGGKVGPTGGEREGDDPGPPPMAARTEPAGGDSGPSGS